MIGPQPLLAKTDLAVEPQLWHASVESRLESSIDSGEERGNKMVDPDEIFARTKELRVQIDEASAAGDLELVERLESEQETLRRSARAASVNVEAAQEELVHQRLALAKMSEKSRRAWKWRFGGAGSPERMGTDPLPSASGIGIEDERERLVARITELEEQLLLVDALHIEPLTPETVTDWT